MQVYYAFQKWVEKKKSKLVSSSAENNYAIQEKNYKLRKSLKALSVMVNVDQVRSPGVEDNAHAK